VPVTEEPEQEGLQHLVVRGADLDRKEGVEPRPEVGEPGGPQARRHPGREQQASASVGPVDQVEQGVIGHATVDILQEDRSHRRAGEIEAMVASDEGARPRRPGPREVGLA